MNERIYRRHTDIRRVESNILLGISGIESWIVLI